MATVKEKIVSSPGKKQPTVRSTGVRYTFPYDVYPRYSYLRSWTARLVPRFRQKIETNSLQECVCNGYKGLQEITKAEKCLQKPSVTLFWKTQPPSSDFQRSLVSTLEPFRYDKLVTCGMAWNDLVNEGIGSSEFDSRVLIIITKDTDKEIAQKLSNLTQAQRESTLIYNPSTSSHRIYKQKIDTSRSLCQGIQALLELKVVILLEKIAFYMEPLVPRDSPEPDKSLLDHITDQLKQFERCCVKEILQEGKTDYNSEDIQGRTPEAEEISRKRKRKKAINENPVYSLTSVEKMPENKRRKKAVNENQGPRKNPSDQLFSEKLEKGQKEKLIKLIGRRTKCQIVEHLSMEYGIHPMVLTSLLCSEKFYNFDSHYDSWISKHEIDELYTAETILRESEAKIRYLVQDVADYMSSQNEHLEGIQKQEFELYGLLRQSDPNVKVKLETKLNPELQDEILSLPEVTGCGTIFGILTLHTSEELPQSTQDNLKHLLQKYNYHRRYRVTVVSSRNDQAGNFTEVDGGSALLAEELGTSMEKHGTLGCFVDVKQKPLGAEESIPRNLNEKAPDTNSTIRKQVFFINDIGDQGTGKNGKSLNESSSREEPRESSISSGLHCITCHHCVKGCKDEVKTLYGQGSFAVRTPYFIESGEKFDIALLRICEGRKEECKLELPGKQNLGAEGHDWYQWRIFDNLTTLAGRPVYKYGSISKFTYGMIASDNYKRVDDITTALKHKKPEQYTDEEKCMNPIVNLIIIGSESTFSKDGDSGAVICDIDINDNTVTAISILHGEVTAESNWLCTYSARLRDSFNELERRFGIKIQVPEFVSYIYIRDPFPPLPVIPDLSPSPERDIYVPTAAQQNMDEPMADREDINEPMADQVGINEPMADHGDMDEPVADLRDMDEPMADLGDIDEPMANRKDMDEPMTHCKDKPLAGLEDVNESMADQQNSTAEEQNNRRAEQMRQEKLDKQRCEMDTGEGAVGGAEKDSRKPANAKKTHKCHKAHFKLNGYKSSKVCLVNSKIHNVEYPP